MTTRSRRTSGICVEGEVVEVFQQGGARWAKLVLKSPTVLDVLTAAMRDVHLGDHIVVDGVLRIDRIRHVAAGEPLATSD